MYRIVYLVSSAERKYEQYFLFAVYRKLAVSVSFSVQKDDFPALVR